MLSSFIYKKTFNKLQLKLSVDCEHKLAELDVTYDRRLRIVGRQIPFWEVMTPEHANRWLARESVTHPEHGTMVEALEHQYRHGYGIAA